MNVEVSIFPDVTMAAQFTISDSESEPEEEVEGGKIKHSLNDPEQVVPHRHNLTLPELRVAGRRKKSQWILKCCSYSCHTVYYSDCNSCKLYQLNSVYSKSHHLFLSGLTGSRRIRLNSESHASTISREEAFQSWGEEEAGTPTEGAPFRGRSRSAPPALWAAKKYGRQLRRMSDEFDSLLDKGVRRHHWVKAGVCNL